MAPRTGIDDEEIQFVSSRLGPALVHIGEWVVLSGVSSQAIHLYVVLMMHVNWDVDATVESAMGLDSETIEPWLQELEAIGAVTARRDQGPKVYLVNETPPPDYAGRQSLITPVQWRPRWRGEPGPVVYYLRREDGQIKIGHTTNLQKRIMTLEASHGPLRVMGYEPGGWELEQQRHYEHRECRTGKTEWFDPTVQLLDHIEALATTVVVADV